MTTRYQVQNPRGVFDFSIRTLVMPEDAGWKTYLEWITAGNTPLPPSTVGTGTLADTKAARCGEIDAYAAGLRNAAVRGRSAGEMSTWSAKLVEARAYTATPNAANAPLLDAIATARGVTLAVMVTKVLAQSTGFLGMEAAIDGKRGAHCDVVNAMTDVQSIITYDWRTGWPAIA